MVITPKELADKIVAGVLKSPGVTYSRLEQHAIKLGIPIGVFENSMQLVHKNKSVQSKILKGVLVYVEREAPKPKVDILLEWRKQNPYPYPKLCTACKGNLCAECYPFYNPDTDTIEKIRASLMMTREEYKAVSEGRTFIPKRKKYEYAR